MSCHTGLLRRLLARGCVMVALALIALPSHALEPLAWTAEEVALARSPQALFNFRLGRVSFERGEVCMNCGDYFNADGHDDMLVSDRMGTFRDFLKTSLQESGLFSTDAKDRLAIRATLLAFERNSTAGRRAEQESIVTGATLVAAAKIRYELMRGDEQLASWTVATRAGSNRIIVHDRLTETLDKVLKRNIQSLLLRIRADYADAVDRQKASVTLQALAADSNVDNTRSIGEALLLGVGKTIRATANVAAASVEFIAQNGDAIQQGVDSVNRQQAANQRAVNSALGIGHRGGGVSMGGASTSASRADDDDRRPGGDSSLASDSSSSTATGATAVKGSGAVADAKGKAMTGKGSVSGTSRMPGGGLTLVSNRAEQEREREEQQRKATEALRQQDLARDQVQADTLARQREEDARRKALDDKERAACLADVSAGRTPCGCAKYGMGQSWKTCSK
ncbi:MAG: hypothetical protein HY836_03400 [Aquabacterium sp.]|uniref:hypothetical protein n=1 Tax=Aquabacterium sp. TaxID=1872578 RepID=UPI0025C12101|nr:hypothetical protein [Aquabacterium sp.]MBI5924619.1 hypothetical protein [Aquabacterium sp.]